MTSVAIAGATGLVGTNILATLLADSSITAVHAFTRRSLQNPSPKLHEIESSEPAKGWPSSFPPNTPLFFSGLGTTRGQAGSFAAQRAIDLDLNVALAKAAKDAGTKTYVLISAHGANSAGRFPYFRMKGELEDAVRAVGFEHLVILQPGLLRGDREGGLRLPEKIYSAAISLVGKVGGQGLEDGLAQEADVVARAAVAAGMQCVKGEREPGAWVVDQKAIVRLGRTEWKGTEGAKP